MMRYWMAVASLVAAAMFTGCGGLPKEVRKEVEELPTRIQTQEQRIGELESAFRLTQKSSAYQDFLKPYAEREDWAGWFTNARNSLADAKRVYDSVLKPLLARNDSNELETLNAELQKANAAIREALDSARRPGERIAFLNLTKEKAPEMVATAKRQFAELEKIYRPIATAIKKAEADFPKKKADIASRFALVRQNYAGADAANTAVLTQSKSGTPDFAVLGDSCNVITRNLAEMNQLNGEIPGKVRELYRSYSKTLVDMKLVEKPYKEVVREEWSTWSDYDDSHEVDRTRSYISMDEYTRLAQQMDANPDGVLLEGGGDYDGYGTYLDDVDIEEECYHKYLVIENGKRSTTDWTQVNSDFFWAHERDLNMDILVKPYGYFEDEVIQNACPPGMACVGNPSYGHWQGTGNNSYWIWYNQWRFYGDLAGGRYDYSVWSDWDRNYRRRQAYYGSGGHGVDRYGTFSASTAKRYSKSNWIRTGGPRMADASVRGAGPARRGGGPGGGGK